MLMYLISLLSHGSKRLGTTAVDKGSRYRHSVTHIQGETIEPLAYRCAYNVFQVMPASKGIG